MKCVNTGCPGKYEDQNLTKSFRIKDKIIVLDLIPAEICNVCGDVLLKPETVQRIEQMLVEGLEPTSSAPVYKYAANS
jgi:YgiT-type zinc finger domain-containing protein